MFHEKYKLKQKAGFAHFFMFQIKVSSRRGEKTKRQTFYKVLSQDVALLSHFVRRSYVIIELPKRALPLMLGAEGFQATRFPNDINSSPFLLKKLSYKFLHK